MSKADPAPSSQDAAPLFSALGDRTRLRLLEDLARGGDASISSLCAGSQTTRQAVTKHLQVLARAGLVQGRRRGREHLYRLQPGRLDEARSYLGLIARQWDDALHRLQRFLEADSEVESHETPTPPAG
jgi:DNA-binding transcriptional ArsR family regulator